MRIVHVAITAARTMESRRLRIFALWIKLLTIGKRSVKKEHQGKTTKTDLKMRKEGL